MLSEEKNQMLTRVGPGQPMGELLRRYWMPVAGTAELGKTPIHPFRLLGEDLVLFRTKNGDYGAIDRHCPHRRADMALGLVDTDGLRCSYHGWKMSPEGDVVERPYDDLINPELATKVRCRTKSYPVREAAGLLWVYMGPLPAPALPVWEPFTWQNGFAEIAIAEVPCNWLQCQENSCDPVHFEWLHENWTQYLGGGPGAGAPRHLQLAFEEFEHGHVYKRVREGQDESSPYWQVGRVALWPVGFYLGSHFEWRVPIDDENTLSVAWMYMTAPKEHSAYRQQQIPCWRPSLKDNKGDWILSHVINQDIVAWVGQGRIADRTKEHLSASDVGIAMMRKTYFQQMEAVANGLDPKGVMRDEDAARCVKLPVFEGPQRRNGLSLDEMLAHPLMGPRLIENCLMAGQPDEVWEEFADAMGLPNKRPAHGQGIARLAAQSTALRVVR